MRSIRIGTGAGFSGDRIEPAVELAEQGELDYLVFECLAERTIALAQQAKRINPTKGFDPLLERRMHAVLPACVAHNVTIVTNAGAANPVAGARAVRDVARSLGLPGLRIAAITGDDIRDRLDWDALSIQDDSLSSIQHRTLSANAYMGAEAIAEALSNGADIVITGRVADPSLFVAPMAVSFGWSMDDWGVLGRGTVAGHLLECAGQVTGGYFADPGVKEVPGLARLGFPIGEVYEDGSVLITKVEGSGGVVSEATCKEQLLYEIHNPGFYLTPDVTADFTRVTVSQVGPDRVQITGGTGRRRPEQLKVSIGYLDGFTGEGQISYAGPGAVDRARLALDIVRERLEISGVGYSEVRFDLIGLNALHGEALSAGYESSPYEVRLRVTGRTEDREHAILIGNEVESLYTNGPAGGGGASKMVREMVCIASATVPRELVQPEITYLES